MFHVLCIYDVRITFFCKVCEIMTLTFNVFFMILNYIELSYFH